MSDQREVIKYKRALLGSIAEELADWRLKEPWVFGLDAEDTDQQLFDEAKRQLRAEFERRSKPLKRWKRPRSKWRPGENVQGASDD